MAAAAAGSHPLVVRQLVGASWEAGAAAQEGPAGEVAAGEVVAGEEAPAAGAAAGVAPTEAEPWRPLLLQWPLTGWH